MVGAPQVRRGDEVVLFLKGSAPAVPMPFGLTQGVYRVSRGRRRPAMVTPPVDADAGTRRPWRSCPASARARAFTEPGANDRERSAMSASRASWIAIAVLLAGLPGTADAYIHLGLRNRWTDQVAQVECGARALVRQRSDGVPGVSASQFQSELARAFTTWEDVPTASIAFQFAGFTSAVPFEDDDLSVFGFESEPDMDRVLGATTFIVDVLTGDDRRVGRLLQLDLPVVGGCDRGSRRGSICSRWPPTRSVISSDSVIRRSAKPRLRPDGGRRVLGSGAVMFPISLGRGVVADRVLQPDDIAGVSDLYPDAGFRADTGIVAGRVRLNGIAVKGAHIVAFDPQTGALIGELLRLGWHLPDRRPDAWSARHSRGAARRCRYRQLPRSARRERELPGHVSRQAHRRARRRRQHELRRRGAAEMSSPIGVPLLPACSDVCVLVAVGLTHKQRPSRLGVSRSASGWAGWAAPSFGEQPADLRAAIRRPVSTVRIRH